MVLIFFGIAPLKARVGEILLALSLLLLVMAAFIVYFVSWNS